MARLYLSGGMRSLRFGHRVIPAPPRTAYERREFEPRSRPAPAHFGTSARKGEWNGWSVPGWRALVQTARLSRTPFRPRKLAQRRWAASMDRQCGPLSLLNVIRQRLHDRRLKRAPQLPWRR